MGKLARKTVADRHDCAPVVGRAVPDRVAGPAGRRVPQLRLLAAGAERTLGTSASGEEVHVQVARAAVDVGHGQLAWSLRQDPKVVVLERTNARHLTAELIADPLDLLVCDASFIGLEVVLPAAMALVRPGGRLIALIKPQFEVGKGKVGKGGVVRDPSLHQQVIDGLSTFFESMGWTVVEHTASPLLGPKGNKEFFVYLKR